MIFTFLVELILVLILWFILKRILRIMNPYTILAVCLTAALVVGFIVAYRGTGFQIGQDYLETINNQKIELTGESITLEEQNAYKEKLFTRGEYQEILIATSLKISLTPILIFVVGILFFIGFRKFNRFLLKKAEISAWWKQSTNALRSIAIVLLIIVFVLAIIAVNRFMSAAFGTADVSEKSEQISKSSLEEIGITQAEIEKWCADNPGTCKD